MIIGKGRIPPMKQVIENVGLKKLFAIQVLIILLVYDLSIIYLFWESGYLFNPFVVPVSITGPIGLMNLLLIFGFVYLAKKMQGQT